MRSRSVARAVLLAAILATMAMIFSFSAETGEESARLSGAITEKLLEAVVPGYAQLPLESRIAWHERVGLFVRKAAHFSEYALLGAELAAYCAARRADGSPLRAAPPAWITAVLYACTDEWHQTFVAGRGPSLRDVAIDAAGALAGVLIAAGIIALARRKRREKA